MAVGWHQVASGSQESKVYDYDELKNELEDTQMRT